MDKAVQVNVQQEVRGGVGSAVDVIGLSKRFGDMVAVNDVTLSIEPGEFLSLLGPSGSGKTTILMSIAGFQQPTSGRIIVGGRDVVPLPANKRNIGMVFQKYALFPHMTVEQNIAFPLQMRGWSKARQGEAVSRVLSIVRLSKFAGRVPNQLSGGQQQRVALARAIVFEPPLLLMDEPLGALDKKLREELQFEIKDLQRRLGITVLFVTHDQDEALAMSDRIAVMNHGCIEQIGKPEALYQTPQTVFVADFMGDSNFFNGTVAGVDARGDVIIDIRGVRLAARSSQTDVSAFRPNARASVMVRPSGIQIDAAGAAGTGGLRGVVDAVMFGGSRRMLRIDIDGQKVNVQIPQTPGREPPEYDRGDQVSMSWSALDAVAFPGEKEA